MALTYNDTVGTATLTAGSTAVTGQGTSWLTTANIGDQIVGNDNRIGTIASVNSNTSLTLSKAWQGTSQTALAYEIRFLSDVVRMQETTRALLNKLTNGNVDALAGLALLADRLIYGNGTGTLGLTTFTAFARSLLDDADAAAFWATLGPTAPPASAFRRGNILGTVSQSSGVPTGAIIDRGSNANGEYVRFADGTQICAFRSPAVTLSTASGPVFVTPSNVSWTFPAAFAASPMVTTNGFRTAGSGTVWAGSVGGTTSTGSTLCRMVGSVTGAEGAIDFIAVGRWF